MTMRVRVVQDVEDGYTPNPVATGTTDGQVVAATPGLRMMGLTVRESAGVPAIASLTIHHGTGGGDPVADVVALLASTGTHHWFGKNGIAMPNGIYLNRLAGETHLVVYTKIIV